MGTPVTFGDNNLGSQIGINNATVTNHFHIPDLAARLPMVHEAIFNSFEDQHEPDCFPGTRIDVLNQIHEWALSHKSSESVEGKCIFWLNGMAGTGKSTISRTVAARFSQVNCLGASFFFKQGEGDRGNATKLISTIARQLATGIPDLRPHIEQAVRDDPDIAIKSMGKQFKALIINPLLELSSRLSSSATQTFLIVIDALDECDRDEDIRMLLRLLPELQQSKGLRIKTFLTSRPELEIRLGFSKFSDHKDFILHEIPKEVVKHDLSLFLNHRLSQIRTERCLPTDWPGKSTIDTLAVLSSPLFIFAATICRMFEDRAFDPVGTLDEILESSDNISKLDRTYLPVLKRVLKESQTTKHREQLIQGFKQVVGAIVMLESPLSVHSLSKFLNITEKAIQARLELFHSVLSVPNDLSLPVRLFHLSFRDFLLDPETCGKTPLWIDAKEMHYTMTMQCLSICQKTLRRNICQLPHEGTLRETLSRETLNRHFPPDVIYACRYWSHHLVQFMGNFQVIQISESLLQNAFSFLKVHFLHWFEAMSLLGLIPELPGILESIANPLSRDHTNRDSDLLRLLVYARLFVQKYSRIADEAPLQLYCAGLIFSPQNETRKLMEGDLPRWIYQRPHVPATWSQEISNFEGHEDTVFKLVFSPDGRLLASISFHAIQLWDLSIGTLRYSFQSDLPDLQSDFDYHCEQVVFSPDSRLLVSVPYQGPIRLWNVVTGVLQDSSITELTDIQNVRFSRDSRLVASVSKTGIIVLHSLETGTVERSLQSDSGGTAIRIFSSGLFLASTFSGGRGGRIELVDIMKGIARPILESHFASIEGMAFSSDGLLLASMSQSDKFIRLWDVMNGTAVAGISSEFGDAPARMIFSPDNKTLVFRSYEAVEFCDSTTGRLKFHLQTADHLSAIRYAPAGFSGVREMAFSVDGSIFVFVGKWGNVFLWESSTGEPIQTYQRDSDLMRSAALAPNNEGLLMAFGSKNGTVRLLDLMISDRLGAQDQMGTVREMIFSADGNLFTCVLRFPWRLTIWDTKSGSKMHTLPRDFDYGQEQGLIRSKEKNRGKVLAMAFSHDSSLLALFDGGEREILIWDVPSGTRKKTLFAAQLVRQIWPYYHHNYEDVVCFLAFSTNGLLALSFCDNVTLWDVVTGARLYCWSARQTPTHLEFLERVDNGSSLTNRGVLHSALDSGRAAFSENGHRVRLSLTLRAKRIRELLRSVGIERSLMEIRGLKGRGEQPVVDPGTRAVKPRYAIATTRGTSDPTPSQLCPQLYIEDNQWIILKGKRALWLPPEFRPELSGQYLARMDPDERSGMIALGFASGQVYFIGVSLDFFM